MLYNSGRRAENAADDGLMHLCFCAIPYAYGPLGWCHMCGPKVSTSQAGSASFSWIAHSDSLFRVGGKGHILPEWNARIHSCDESYKLGRLFHDVSIGGGHQLRDRGNRRQRSFISDDI